MEITQTSLESTRVLEAVTLYLSRPLGSMAMSALDQAQLITVPNSTNGHLGPVAGHLEVIIHLSKNPGSMGSHGMGNSQCT